MRCSRPVPRWSWCSAPRRSRTRVTLSRRRSRRSVGARAFRHAGRSGNLLLVAQANGRPVLGAPGCARSPKENGFDWILMRLLAGLPIRRSDITGLGVGGLLMEIVTRPQPRAEPEPEKGQHVAGLISPPAARPGWADRTSCSKRSTARRWCASPPKRRSPRVRSPVIVVTGHQRERVERALAGLPVTFVHNPDFAEGLSTSLKTGIAAVPAEADGAIVSLGDMPQVSAKLIDRLIAAFDPERGALVVIPTIGGKRGNPVLWARRFFPDLARRRGRCRGAPPDRRLRGSGRRSAARRRRRADGRRYARGARGGSRWDDRLVPFKGSPVTLAGVWLRGCAHALGAVRGMLCRACFSDRRA